MSHAINNSCCSEPCVSKGNQKNGWFSSIQRSITGVNLWMQRYRQRKMLATIEPRLLKDMGITQDRLHEELSKPFWR